MIFASLCFLLNMAVSAPSEPSQIAFAHVAVIDVLTGSAKPGMTVLIVGKKISAVGPGEGTRLPRHLRIIDGRGKFLMPGLWDMHVHLGGDHRALRMLLASGITGVRDMGGDVPTLSESRRRLVSGSLLGPRLVFAGPLLAGPSSQADSGTWVIRSPLEARQAIDTLIKQRADFIKVHDGLARDTFLAIVDAAKARGIPFAGHVPASMTPAEVSDLGQKSIEHLEFMPKACLALFDSAARAAGRVPPGCEPEALQELLDRFARNGTWLDPTIQSFRYFAPTQWDAIFAGFRDLAKLIRQSHVFLLAGTDCSGFLEKKGDAPGRSLHDELALLVEAGFTPAEALRAATSNPASFLGLSNSLGTIEPGKIADLVLLEANPLQNIGNTKRIAAVISAGRFLDRKRLASLLRASN